MDGKDRKIYEFGSFRLDVTERLLWKDGELLSPTPKVFDLLALLVANHGHLLEKETLVEELWPGSFVEEANLNVNISALRRVLGEAPNENKFIETVPRRGYRFVAEVRGIAADTAEPDAAAEPVSQTAGKKISRRKFSARVILIVLVAVLVLLIAGFYVWRTAFENGSSGDVRTIAVLPFKPLTRTGGDEVLEMGMADALITRLSNLRQVTVRPTSSVLKYTEANTDFMKIGRELQVEAVLDGRIQRADNKIRVTVQLIRTSDGESLWADSFDDYFTNIFAVQDSISEMIAEKLSVRLTRAEEETMNRRDTESSEAYSLYLQGQYHHNKASPEELEKALVFYRQAVEKDPEYVLPYAGMSEIYQSFVNYNIDPDMSRRKASEYAEKAIRLNPNSAEGWTALGRVRLYIDWDFAGSGEAFRRAVGIKPKDPGIRHSYSSYLSSINRSDEAVREMQTALRLDPVSVYINNDFVRILMSAHRFDEALAQAKKAAELDPRYVFTHRNLAFVYSMKGMHREAIGELQQEAELGGLKKVTAISGYVYARAGNRSEAEKVLQDYRNSFGQVGVNYLNLALIHLGLGEKDLAIENLEKS